MTVDASFKLRQGRLLTLLKNANVGQIVCGQDGIELVGGGHRNDSTKVVQAGFGVRTDGDRIAIRSMGIVVGASVGDCRKRYVIGYVTGI